MVTVVVVLIVRGVSSVVSFIVDYQKHTKRKINNSKTNDFGLLHCYICMFAGQRERGEGKEIWREGGWKPHMTI